MSPALEFDHTSLRRGGRTVLSDLNLQLPGGSLTVVLGPNGAGKSTLLRAAEGELTPSEGRVLTLGSELSSLGWRASAALRKRIGVMPQLPSHAPAAPLSVREVVEISRVAHAPFRPSLSAEDRALCDHWINRFGLGAYSNRPYSTLSGGEQRKAHLARIFAQQPDLVLLDEPAGHLDLPSQDDLVRLLGELWNETASSIVIVTHDLRQLPPETTHVLLLSKGKLLAFGAPEETLTNPLLSELFGESVSVVKHCGHYLAVSNPRKAVSHG